MKRTIFTILVLIAPLNVHPQMKFALFGDYGCDEPAEFEVSQLVKSWNPDFIVTLGDNNYYEGNIADSIDHNIGKYYHEFIKPYIGNYGSGSSPVNKFFPALGNHDLYDYRWIGPNDIRNAGHTYYNYFKLTDTCIHKGNTPDLWSPLGVRYYKFRKGDVEFFIANSGISPDNHRAFSERDGIDSNSVQAQWMKTQIQNSSAKWKIVVIHHPPYSSVPLELIDAYEVLRWNFKQWGASVVFSGHNHTYESLIVSGLPYFICGLGGEDKNEELLPSYPGSRFQYVDNFGAIQCTEYTDSIAIKFISKDYELVDSFRLTDLSNDPGISSSEPADTGAVYTGSSNCFNVNLRNYGKNNLDSVPVYCIINDTLTLGPVISGLTYSYDTSSVFFCGGNAFTPQFPGNYSLKFFTTLSGDTNKLNDTLCYSVQVIDSIKDAGISYAANIDTGYLYKGMSLTFRGVLKNFGSNDLSCIPVNFSINGEAGPGFLTGALASGDSVELTFNHVPQSPGDYEFKFYSELSGDINRSNDTVSVLLTVIDSPHVTLDIKAIPEGLYDNSDNRLRMSDTIISYLYDASNPYTPIDSAVSGIDSATFTGVFRYYNTPEGDFYISIKHRNSIETWSRLNINIANMATGEISYDFTEDSTMAFGFNQVKVNESPLKYAIYSGDIDQDGIIDLTDLVRVFNDAQEFMTGYQICDLTGESIVDLSDVLIAFNNSFKFVERISP